MKARARVVVSGHVQGVMFRKSVMDMARVLAVSGWVRNLRDGRVEAVIEGEKDKVVELVEYCHRGPQGARVKDVVVEWSEPNGDLRGFRISH